MTRERFERVRKIELAFTWCAEDALREWVLYASLHGEDAYSNRLYATYCSLLVCLDEARLAALFRLD